MIATVRRSTFIVLYRHFLKEYFYVETASGHQESGLSVWHVVAFLFVPGVFLCGFSLMKTGPLLAKPPADFVISGLDDRLVFIVLAVVVAGFASVLNLHKLLPRQRRIDSLSTLPISLPALVCAKIVAYLSFVLLFCVDANLVSTLIYPLTSAPADATVGIALRFFAAHFLTVFCCTAFTIAAVSGCYALVRILLPKAITFFELATVAGLVAFLFVGPVSLKLLLRFPSLARFNPAMWFLGMYESLLPFTSPDVFYNGHFIVFHFSALARNAVFSTSAAVVAALVTVAIACVLLGKEHKGRSGKVLFPRNRLALMMCRLVPAGIPRAAAAAYWAGLSRVHECQLALAVFIGTATGVILNELAAADDGSGWFFIAPFVLTFFLITGLVAVARLSVHLDARWILQISPALRASEVRRGINWSIALLALLPVLIVLTVVYGSALGYAAAATLMASCGLLALVLLETITWTFSIFPFAHEATMGKQNLPVVFVGYALALATYGLAFGRAAGWLLQSHRLGSVNVVLAATFVAVHYAHGHGDTGVEVTFTEVDQDQVQLLNL